MRRLFLRSKESQAVLGILQKVSAEDGDVAASAALELETQVRVKLEASSRTINQRPALQAPPGSQEENVAVRKATARCSRKTNPVDPPKEEDGRK
ncbi:hypothetical protein ACSSS7_002450 [Eimeria intestinalis]